VFEASADGAREGDDDDDDGDDDDGDDDDDRGPHQQPNDVCPNIEGLQTSVPAGFVKDAAGNCIWRNSILTCARRRSQMGRSSAVFVMNP
jgi:hypothetical protein